MATIDDITTVEPVDVLATIKDVLEEIKDMVGCALAAARKSLAGGALVALMLLSNSGTVNNRIIDDTIPPVEITAQTTASIRLATESEAKERLEERLSTLATLEDGWDGEAAMRPSPQTLCNARMLIEQIDDTYLGNCTLFPSNDAGIFLKGRLGNGKIMVFVNDSQMSYVIKNKSGKISASVPFTIQGILYLNQGLEQYV